MVARDGQRHRAERTSSGCVVVEVNGHVGHLLEQILADGRNAADVEKSGHGAGSNRSRIGIAGIASVVLSATTNGDMVDCQACRWREQSVN